METLKLLLLHDDEGFSIFIPLGKKVGKFGVQGKTTNGAFWFQFAREQSIAIYNCCHSHFIPHSYDGKHTHLIPHFRLLPSLDANNHLLSPRTLLKHFDFPHSHALLYNDPHLITPPTHIIFPRFGCVSFGGIFFPLSFGSLSLVHLCLKYTHKIHLDPTSENSKQLRSVMMCTFN